METYNCIIKRRTSKSIKNWIEQNCWAFIIIEVELIIYEGLCIIFNYIFNIYVYFCNILILTFKLYLVII